MLTGPVSRLALIHPPALSPVVWRPVAEALRAGGHEVAVPDYTAELTVSASWWRRATMVCGTAIDDLVSNPPPAPADREGSRQHRAKAAGPDVLVAFSGSGVLMPLIANARPPARAVFVDAVLPAASGRHTVPSAPLREFVAGLRAEHAGGERLPRWTQWWDPQELADLLPDAEFRAELEAASPQLPASFYDEAVGMAPGWEPPTVDYVQLSAAYDAEAAEASRRGWQVHRIDGTHLSVATDPQSLLPLLTP